MDEVDEIIQMAREVRSVPDAWKLRDEEPEHASNHPVLVLEFLEVEVTSHVDDRKIEDYERFWWLLD
ncbi:MAG: hypothetical protein HY705_01360, partial [Gemmatimonadetes bacterium]|nr:hypothetical protein [Gemmatimonadota bacterium]